MDSSAWDFVPSYSLQGEPLPGSPARPLQSEQQGGPSLGCPARSSWELDEVTEWQAEPAWQAGPPWWQNQRPSSKSFFGDHGDHPAPKAIHDNPPTWDGKDPDRQLEPYLKLLEGWMATTRTMKKQRGMVILHYATGDLRMIINELEISILTSEDSDWRVLQHIQESYQEYLEKRLPKAMERALFSPEGRRGQKESMLQYVARKRTLFQELTRVQCELPSQALGYLMLRDAGLNERAWDTVETWTKGSYELTEIAVALRRL